MVINRKSNLVITSITLSLFIAGIVTGCAPDRKKATHPRARPVSANKGQVSPANPSGRQGGPGRQAPVGLEDQRRGGVKAANPPQIGVDDDAVKPAQNPNERKPEMLTSKCRIISEEDLEFDSSYGHSEYEEYKKQNFCTAFPVETETDGKIKTPSSLVNLSQYSPLKFKVEEIQYSSETNAVVVSYKSSDSSVATEHAEATQAASSSQGPVVPKLLFLGYLLPSDFEKVNQTQPMLVVLKIKDGTFALEKGRDYTLNTYEVTGQPKKYMIQITNYSLITNLNFEVRISYSLKQN